MKISKSIPKFFLITNDSKTLSEHIKAMGIAMGIYQKRAIVKIRCRKSVDMKCQILRLWRCTWVDPDKVRAKKPKSALQIPEQFFFLVTRTDNDHENSPDDASALLLNFDPKDVVGK